MIMNKMEIRAMALSVATFCAFACAKETVENTGNGGDSLQRHHITINATADSEDHEDASTKVIFPGNIKSAMMYWQKDDQIGVQASGSESLYPLSVESRSTNLLSAVFAGDIEGTLGGYAVYPYNEGHKISGNTLTYHLPSEYDYSDSPNAFDTDWVENSDKIDDSKAKANFALLAKITENQSGGGSTEFKHLGGLLCIKIDKMPASSCTLTVTADKRICGDFTIDDPDSEQPHVDSDDESSVDNVVTVKTHGIAGTSCVYYIPMPVGEYNLNVKLSSVSVYGKEYASCTSTKKIDIGRKEIKRVSFTQSTMYKGGYQIIDNYKFIDLGLPSGVLWAETNVGATLPADFGNFYAWGETAERETSSDGYNYYDFANYKYHDTIDGVETFTKYNSGSKLLTLATSDDAAYTNWTTKCWTPTKDQVQELIDNTTATLNVSKKNSNGNEIEGVEFKSKNGNSIFLPYNGYYEGAYYNYYYGGRYSPLGCYWTNNLEPVENGSSYGFTKYKYVNGTYLQIDSKNKDVAICTQYLRYYGMGVRPVANPN